jgi:hypothetical protein
MSAALFDTRESAVTNIRNEEVQLLQSAVPVNSDGNMGGGISSPPVLGLPVLTTGGGKAFLGFGSATVSLNCRASRSLTLSLGTSGECFTPFGFVPDGTSTCFPWRSAESVLPGLFSFVCLPFEFRATTFDSASAQLEISSVGGEYEHCGPLFAA